MKRKLRKIFLAVPYIRSHLQQIKVLKKEVEDRNSIIEKLTTQNKNLHDEVTSFRNAGKPESYKIQLPVFKDDLLGDAAKTPSKTVRHKPPFTLNWVIPPMNGDTISGGHTDIFRTIAYLEKRGHSCRVYFYDALKKHNLPELSGITKQNYPNIKAELFYNQKDMQPCDAIFATHWHTAYSVAHFKEAAKKYYYIQDFEPMFDPAGTFQMLAENTYNLGLYGLTLGKWLKDKISDEYGMKCDSFDFGTDLSTYRLINQRGRKDVLFYARPSTPRRGFELGLLALEIFHKNSPATTIHFVGEDVSIYKISFPYINHGALSSEELNNIYNDCAAGLVISLTNMSILPLEMLAAGCLPVINDAVHTRKVNYSSLVRYSQVTAEGLAEGLLSSLRDFKPEKAVKLAKQAKNFNWDSSNQKIEEILIRDIGA